MEVTQKHDAVYMAKKPFVLLVNHWFAKFAYISKKTFVLLFFCIDVNLFMVRIFPNFIR